jgi:hypothetical protein
VRTSMQNFVDRNKEIANANVVLLNILPVVVIGVSWLPMSLYVYTMYVKSIIRKWINRTSWQTFPMDLFQNNPRAGTTNNKWWKCTKTFKFVGFHHTTEKYAISCHAAQMVREKAKVKPQNAAASPSSTIEWSNMEGSRAVSCLSAVSKKVFSTTFPTPLNISRSIL